MKSFTAVYSVLLLLALLLSITHGEDAAEEAADDTADDGMGAPEFDDISILPLRCVTNTDGVDSVIVELFENDGQCASDRYVLTSIVVSVSSYAGAYFAYMEETVDDYEEPANYEYIACTGPNDNGFYEQLGCSESSNSYLTVNVFTDNTCLSMVDSDVVVYDEDGAAVTVTSTVDASALQLDFSCQACVTASDDGDSDDDEEEEEDSSFCSKLWYADDAALCDGDCMELGMVPEDNEWSSADVTIFSFLLISGLACISKIYIEKQRTIQSEALLSGGALEQQGFPFHLFAVALSAAVVILALASTGAIFATISLLIVTDTCLALYLLKVTLFQKSRQNSI